jgi:hypothetical protein
MTLELLAVFVVSVLLALGLRLWPRVRIGDALTAAIMFVPALLYWADGKPLEEISGGTEGITLKLRAAAALPVSKIDLKLESVAIKYDPDRKIDMDRAGYWGECWDYVTVRSSDVPVDVSTRDRYIVTLAIAIRASLLCGRLIGIVVVDERERYIGSYDDSFFVELAALWTVAGAESRLSVTDIASLFRSHTIFGASLRFPEKRLRSGEGFVAAINRDAPLAAALERFAETNVPFLALTDEYGTLTSILPRQRVVNIVLQTLVAPSSEGETIGD